MNKVFIVIDHEDIIQVYDNMASARQHCAEVNQYYDTNSYRVVEVKVWHSF